MCDGIGRKNLTYIPQMSSNFMGFITQSKRKEFVSPMPTLSDLLSVSSGLFSSDVVNGVDHRHHNVRLWQWSQLIDATLYLKRKDGVSSDEARISSRVQYGREDGVVGSLAARGVVESDWAGVW